MENRPGVFSHNFSSILISNYRGRSAYDEYLGLHINLCFFIATTDRIIYNGGRKMQQININRNYKDRLFRLAFQGERFAGVCITL